MPEALSAAHVFAAVILVGHLVYWASRVRPARPLAEAPADEVFSSRVHGKTRWIGWFCLIALVVTGIVMLSNWHVTVQRVVSGHFLYTRFGRLMMVKLVGTALLALGLVYSSSTTRTLACLNLLAGMMLILVSTLLVR
jgi:hypothetical protein